MTILEFHEKFNSSFNRKKNKFSEKIKTDFIGNKDWTAFIEDLIRNIFEKENLNCISQHKLGKQFKEEMKEFLSIDFSVFKSDKEYFDLDGISSWMMEYAIEHENYPDRIGYNISKLLNIKAANKIFIGYTKKEEDKQEIFDKIIEQIDKISPSHFDEKERLLIMLGHDDMSDKKDYESKLIYLKSKKIKELEV